MPNSEKLNIADDKGNIIGEETRENIHKKGLLHREIHVWLYTPGGEIIFQHRAKGKETYPDLLDATVGGHVGLGEEYEVSALRELGEETGLKVSGDKLILIRTERDKSYDQATGKTNNVLRKIFSYLYEGRAEDLKLEDGEAIGFEIWPFDKIFNISEENKKKFIPGIISEDTLEIFKKIQGSLIKNAAA